MNTFLLKSILNDTRITIYKKHHKYKYKESYDLWVIKKQKCLCVTFPSKIKNNKLLKTYVQFYFNLLLNSLSNHWWIWLTQKTLPWMIDLMFLVYSAWSWRQVHPIYICFRKFWIMLVANASTKIVFISSYHF